GRAHSARTAMENDDMDVDMEIDLGPIDGPVDGDEPQVTTDQINLTSLCCIFDIGGQSLDQCSLNSVQPAVISLDIGDVSAIATEHETPQKVHIRGVDDLTTADIKAFSAEHFPTDSPLHIEWIDDTSANIVYDTAAIASMALNCFTLSPPFDMPYSPLQLRAAKTFSSHPESSLHVRIALFTDQKRPRAYEASRFYMMHPEYDPREQRRRDRSSRSGRGEYQRRRYAHEEHRRRIFGDKDEVYNPTMYDDESRALAHRHDRVDGVSIRRASRSTRSSFSSADDRNIFQDRRTRTRRRTDTYWPWRSSGKGRGNQDRSASPGRDDRGHLARSGRRNSRRRTPPPPYQARDPCTSFADNSGKELFPLKPQLVTVLNKAERDLVSSKGSVGNLKKELFPNKSTSRNHRRTDAFDAADETVELFATEPNMPVAVGVAMSRHSLTGKLVKNHTSSYGRSKSSDSVHEIMALEVLNDGGLNIRGSSQMHDSDFSIRGAADDVSCVPHVKELFPEKAAGNAGKELFANKLQGRGGKRNKAEDMFY
ncbi:hypothetical protein MMC07_009042, partial [Pseudocyphellaria aurata]|nr:hypothetical protein [Pseudocyphellaria aurata]